MAFDDALDGDVYTFVYLTNGSAGNVWSRTLLDSAMAVVAPDRFPMEALSERLVAYATQAPGTGGALAQANVIRASTPFDGALLERSINDAGYGIRENLGIAPAIRVFELNTQLFPGSANVWDSLAEAYQAKGDAKKARALYDKARRLAPRQDRPQGR